MGNALDVRVKAVAAVGTAEPINVPVPCGLYKVRVRVPILVRAPVTAGARFFCLRFLPIRATIWEKVILSKEAQICVM